ncbi:undecaprenyl-phosphate alpha-N-acetylglucosaminyl 1-phosphate transferase [Cytophagales bacterium WSM2-2]|nr:undecaprenyl-phosphate alpha-N-acetylglucosaminyl 1-phosphate transferase [Cytophagales bacterium WSM2-2]
MAVNLAACITSFLVSFLILPLIIKYSFKKNLVDIPGGRKIHKKVTPSLGGIAIFAGFIVASLIWLDFDQWQTTRYTMASIFIIFLIGVRDDLVPFRASHKLLGQIVAVIILMFSTIRIHSLYGFLGVTEIPTILSYLITAFTIIVITNAFNLIDGLDGLAGSVGLISLLVFGIWFYWVEDYVFSLFSFAMAGGILSFLVFNWEPSEIFMGDTGAMIIGMLLAILVIRFMNLNYDLVSNHPAKFSASITSAGCFIIIPLCDTLRIIILRLYKGQSPFTPDKSHIHHAIMRLGMTHSKTAIILAIVNISYVALAILFKAYDDNYLLAGIVIFSGALSFFLDRLILKKLSGKQA